jgi:hypothetical protein
MSSYQQADIMETNETRARRSRRAQQSPEQRAAVNAIRRAQLSTEQRASQNMHRQAARAQESPDQRAARLLREREKRRERETPEERAARLLRERERRRARETPEERARREQRTRQAQERARLLEERRLHIQIRMRPAMHCNMDSLVLLEQVYTYFNVGACTYDCDYCGSLGFKGENRSASANSRHHGILCCNKGKIMLDDIPPLPLTLHDLFNSTSNALSRHFRKKIRLFNAGMAMASLQANDRTVTRGAPGCFKIVGQLYRRIGSLLPDEESTAKCLQVYFLDPEYQANLRATRYLSNERRASASPDENDVRVFQMLHTSLTAEAHNTYITSFLSVVEWIRATNQNPEEVHIQLHETEKPSGGQHPGRYHLPSAPEISILLPSREQMATSRSSIVCSVRPQVNDNGTESLQIIRDHHRSIWPLLYLVLFPYGTDGWDEQIKSNNSIHQ